MKTVAIIQARMGSARLPGKVLVDIAGMPMLARVVDRVRRAAAVDETVVATGRDAADDAIEAWCRQHNIACVRGSEADVLDRYHQAARRHAADLVVRVTADCPLLDPALLDDVASALATAQPPVAFAANTIARSYPRGLDVEAMWAEDLARLHRVALEPYYREHVFPYAHEHPEEFPHVSLRDGTDRSWMRWTVDTPEDLAFVRCVAAALQPDDTDWHVVLRLLDAHPEWLDVNRGVEQKPLRA